jgi:predicted membrane protein
MPSDLLEPLRGALARERISLLIGAIVLELVAMAFVLPASPAFCTVINMHDPGGAIYIIWAMGVGSALGIAFMVRRVIALRDIDRTPIMIKLRHDPEDVVWVHGGIAVEQRVYGETVSRSRHIAFLTESRDNHSIEMGEHAARRVVHAMETYLPHATVGEFSPKLLERYHADPASLRLKTTSKPREPREGGSYRDAPAEPKAPAKTKAPLPAPTTSPYWLSAIVCVALVLVAPTIASAVLGGGSKDGAGTPHQVR